VEDPYSCSKCCRVGKENVLSKVVTQFIPKHVQSMTVR